MRTDLSVNRLSWLCGLDYKKLIIVVCLLRIISASAYDIYVTMTGNDILLPDSRFYSATGRYVNILLHGYDSKAIPKDMLPASSDGRIVFFDIIKQERGELPVRLNESNVFAYIVGIIYFIFGYFTIWIRLFNIFISIISVYMLFTVARKQFGQPAANLFLVAALLLPTQFGYSITLSRDFLRVFMVSLGIWIIYNMGDIWTKKLRHG